VIQLQNARPTPTAAGTQETSMSQQIYTTVQVSIICILACLVAVAAVWNHPEWFDSVAGSPAAVASTGNNATK
jgi:hypothetical protein